MKKTLLSTVVFLVAAVMMFTPIRAKAAEVIQPEEINEALFFIDDIEGSYNVADKDAVFNRHDAEGNLISSTKVEEGLFIINADGTGWGQANMNGTLVYGTFEGVTIDTKSYLRGAFTTESSVVYDIVCAKVKPVTNDEWSAKLTEAQATEAERVAAEEAAALGNNSVNSNNNNGNSGGNNNSGDDNNGGGNNNSGGNNNGGGITRPGIVGWTPSVTRPGHTGWT